MLPVSFTAQSTGPQQAVPTPVPKRFLSNASTYSHRITTSNYLQIFRMNSRSRVVHVFLFRIVSRGVGNVLQKPAGVDEGNFIIRANLVVGLLRPGFHVYVVRHITNGRRLPLVRIGIFVIAVKIYLVVRARLMLLLELAKFTFSAQLSIALDNRLYHVVFGV